MFHATTPTKGPSTVDCEVLTDIHTQPNLAEIEIVSLVQELIPRYRLRADTDFACSNEDFIQTPRINGSEFEPLTNTQIRALLDYYASSNNRITQMTKTYHDINAVTRMLEDREIDLQMAVSLGHALLGSNDSLRNQVTLLEQDIEQTTEIVKQLKHDLLLKERLIRFYTDMDLDRSPTETNQFDCHNYEQKIRHLEYENQELRAESMQLKLESENDEHQEQSIVDHFADALAHANTDIENLHDEMLKKNEENLQQQDEIIRLSYEMREIHYRLNELRKENEELKILLSLTGKTRHEYETKIEDLEKNYSECLTKLHKSQLEINTLQKNFLQNSPSSPISDINLSRHTVFLSPIEYANFMSLENSLKSELEEVLEDPNQLCPSTINTNKKVYRRRVKRGQSDTDGESSMNDSAFSDTESLSSASSCRFCQRSSPIPIDEPKSISSTIDRKLPSGISSRLRLVKRLEGSNMLKRWQELAEPSLSSCLQSTPGVYTRAEILHDVKEENEEDLLTPQNESEDRLSITHEKHSPETPIHPQTSKHRMNLVELLTKQGLTARTLDSPNSYSDFQKAFLTSPLPNRLPQSTTAIIPNPDESDEDDVDDDDEPKTPPSSPIHGAQFQTSALLHQVMQRLVGISLRTFETLATSLTSLNEDDESTQRLRTTITITPPSSPTFEGLAAPTPNTAMRAIKTSTFLRVSSLNPYTNKSIRHVFATRSPGEVPSVVDDLIKSFIPRI